MVEKEREDDVEYIKWLLKSMDDGRISISPYDTAWIALIPNADDEDGPQFPSSLEWIAENQLSDGSWGDARLFSAYDRLLNTLACVIALQTWNVHRHECQNGICFIQQNISKLESATEENMTCGFEILFPALLEKAQAMGIHELPYDAPVLEKIFATRDVKHERIPMELVHQVPTAMLYNLEGLQDLDWKKLLRLQTSEGHFLTSPSSTASAYMETKDDKCFGYLDYVVTKFNGGAPTNYPVDLYARLWAVDRLERLGISRYFNSEINDLLEYVYRYWSEDGIFCARETNFRDIDDTSMGFRLLRLHGYDTSPEVLENFKVGDEFCCYPGQIAEGPTPIFNLYRASQISFPGEIILEQAHKFSLTFLKEKLLKNELHCKWLISKDFEGEVAYGVEVPWFADLPRVHARLYIDHYGGADDAWIGKSLYKMPEINNDAYLQLAKSDYRKCQAQHLKEWDQIKLWCWKRNFQNFGVTEESVLLPYFVASASIFEIEKSKERLAWAKSLIFIRITKQMMDQEEHRLQQLDDYLAEFSDDLSIDDHGSIDRYINHQLNIVWRRWLTNLRRKAANCGEEAELIVHTVNICGGRVNNIEGLLYCPDYQKLSITINRISQLLQERGNQKKSEKDAEVVGEMRALLQMVLQKSGGVDTSTKQTFLTVAKTMYYVAHCPESTITFHISKILFQKVI